MKKNIKKAVLFAILIPIVVTMLSSCSVVMASRKSGTDVTQIQHAQTRTQILATGAELVESNKNKHEHLVETYKVQKERGSTARAVMHGVLDVWTLGIWEAVGTPMEGYMSEKEYYIVRVTYDEDERVKKIELV